MNTVSERSPVLDEDGQLLARFRGQIYQVVTIDHGKTKEGARVERLQLKGAGIEIPVLAVGEEGRGRRRGIVSVQLDRDSWVRWEAKNEEVLLKAAHLGATKAGKIKFLERETPNNEDFLLTVFRTPLGFCGSNSHTGDRTGEYRESSWGEQTPVFHPFPGITLEHGVIAQGCAGRAGSGEELIALMPREEVFRTGYSGRLYGGPSAHYYKFDGQRVLSATWEERAASDIF